MNAMGKILSSVVILLFIGLAIAPSINAILPEKQNADLPDFVIEDVKIFYSDRGWPMADIYIKNLGASVDWNRRGKMTIKKLFQDENLYSKNDDYGGVRNHPSGAIKTVTLLEFDMESLPGFFFARVFFEVDDNNKVEESNENNNVVWAYMFCYWYWLLNERVIAGRFKIGKLRMA
jgi:hypothetical protein